MLDVMPVRPGVGCVCTAVAHMMGRVIRQGRKSVRMWPQDPHLGSNPVSNHFGLCDVSQVTLVFCASVSSSVK